MEHNEKLVISDTGYIRLLYSELQNQTLVHLISGLDEDGPDLPQDGAVPTAITGYTEWVSEGRPVITVGWDWQMLSDHSNIGLHRVGGPSSNVMLVSPGSVDLGPQKTAVLLETFIDGFDWQPVTLEYVSTRYGGKQ